MGKGVRDQPGRHESSDEYVEDDQCSKTRPHEDHYWSGRTGRSTNLIEEDTYHCHGIDHAA